MPQSGAGYQVLVVEDHALNVELVRDLLEPEGVAVAHAASGEAALAMIARERPDLVLIDLTLPGMNGLEAIRRMKEGPATRGLRVVVVTARVMKSDREAALAHGADAFLTKPLDTRTFAREILALLRAGGEPLPAGRRAGPGSPGGRATPLGAPHPRATEPGKDRGR